MADTVQKKKKYYSSFRAVFILKKRVIIKNSIVELYNDLSFKTFYY